MTHSPATKGGYGRDVSHQDLSVVLDQGRARIESTLDRYLPRASELDSGADIEDETCCPPRLAKAMRYAVLGGGKRLRPVLTLLASEACGGSWESALPVACALEMIHAYSLVHDDLPAMDDDDLRRGRPTCHKAFDEATAILAGDALLTLAFEITARHIHPPTAAAACVRVLAEAAGPSGMVGGQMADLLAEGHDLKDGVVADLESIHRRKTGALLRASLELGAIAASASREEVDALASYGRSIGLAFQIIDDLLDAQGDESKMGKRARKDSNAGKWTYPEFLGMDGSRRRARELAENAVLALAPLGQRGAMLTTLAWNLLERDR